MRVQNNAKTHFAVCKLSEEVRFVTLFDKLESTIRICVLGNDQTRNTREANESNEVW